MSPARTYEVSPQEGFPCGVDPGGLYEELKTSFHLPGAVGRPEGALVAG